MIKKFAEAIVATYPEDIWKPIPKELRAKDAVMAQAMRDMSNAIANIVYQVHLSELSRNEKETENRVWKNLDNVLKKMSEQNQITQAILGALEYRGFFDGGKYLDPTIWERILPVISSTLLSQVKE